MHIHVQIHIYIYICLCTYIKIYIYIYCICTSCREREANVYVDVQNICTIRLSKCRARWTLQRCFFPKSLFLHLLQQPLISHALQRWASAYRHLCRSLSPLSKPIEKDTKLRDRQAPSRLAAIIVRTTSSFETTNFAWLAAAPLFLTGLGQVQKRMWTHYVSSIQKASRPCTVFLRRAQQNTQMYQNLTFQKLPQVNQATDLCLSTFFGSSNLLAICRSDRVVLCLYEIRRADAELDLEGEIKNFFWSCMKMEEQWFFIYWPPPYSKCGAVLNFLCIVPFLREIMLFIRKPIGRSIMISDSWYYKPFFFPPS